MRVLLLTRYDRLGASSRLRSLQYIPWLQDRGIHVSSQPLLPDIYIRKLYQGEKKLRYAIGAFLKRIGALRRYREFDLLWIEKELFPWLPFLVENRWLDGPPVLLDFDDAIFHNYDSSSNPIVRFLLGSKIDRLMGRVAAVSVGNSYLANRARHFRADGIEILPTAVNLERYQIRGRRIAAGCVVGWIGTPGTAMYLNEVGDALNHVSKTDAARVVLIGSGPKSLPEVPTEIHTWFEDNEQEKLRLFDIGIMPLTDALWERGKCGYKLIQYMATGIPVVASPVGANAEIVDHGENGFLASTREEWIHYLTLLIRDPDLRHRMGLAGRRKVERHYSTSVVAPRLGALMRRVANPHGTA